MEMTVKRSSSKQMACRELTGGVSQPKFVYELALELRVRMK